MLKWPHPKIMSKGKEIGEKLYTKRIIILLGPPTSGKTSQMTNILNETGDPVLRGRDILPALSKEAEKNRDLIPDKSFIPVLEARLSKFKDSNVTLENIPRTKRQAELLKKWADVNGHEIVVFSLELTQQQVLERSEQRLECSKCHLAYHPQLKPPRFENRCDVHTEQVLDRRPGDESTLLIKAFKRHQKLKEQIIGILVNAVVHKIDASGTVEEVFSELKQKLQIK